MENHLKILLLEDSSTDAELIERVLKKSTLEFELRHVSDKENYLEAIEQFSPDLVLSDNSLPDYNATEAIQLLRQRSIHIPFILVTGTVSDEFAASIIKLGADDYILKDRMERLPAAIDSTLKQKRLEKERQDALDKLIQSEENYRTIFLKSPLPMWIYNAETLRFLEVNEATVQHYGYSPEEFSAMTIKDIRPAEEVELLLQDMSKIQDDPGIRHGTWKHLKKNGELILVETTAHSFDYNNRNARMVIINDVTEKIKAEETMRRMEQEILSQNIQEQKKITRAIITAQEKERNRIGQELHDNVNQILASTKMFLDKAGRSNEIMKELIKYPMELIDSTIREIRQLSHQQVTPLKDVHLRELVSSQLDKLRENTGMQTALSYEVADLPLGDDLKLNIYRIIQEQINNIVKYAEAKNISISIQANEKLMRVTVQDDGKGFEVKKKRKGVGISNMINRVESFNGTMAINSSPGKGCKIEVSIPIQMTADNG